LEDENVISYKVLRRGTPVISADGVRLGSVRRTQEAKRENIFDGIVIDTPNGRRFVDAPEVARITDRAVTLTFVAADAERNLQLVPSRLGGRLRNVRTVRRAKRLGDRARDAWDRR
jgi:hypothetical protein